jgi:hypothetical protein
MTDSKTAPALLAPRATRAATPPPPQHLPLPPSSSLVVARADHRESVQMRGWRRRGHGHGTSPPASPAWLGRRAWNQIRWRTCSVGCGPCQRRSCLCSWGVVRHGVGRCQWPRSGRSVVAAGWPWGGSQIRRSGGRICRP